MFASHSDSQSLLKSSLWVDGVDALRHLQDKHVRQILTRSQAVLVRQFIEQGYCTIPEAISGLIIKQGWADLESAYARNSDLTCHKEGFGTFSIRQAEQLFGMNNRQYAVHDFHAMSDAVLAVATHSAHATVVEAVLDAAPILMQSQMFQLGSEKGAHCDFPYCPLVSPLHTVTVWVAGERVSEDAGPLYYYPRSHRLPPYEFSDGNVLWSGGDDLGEIRKYNLALMDMCENAGLERRLFLAPAGSVLIFNSRLVHGALPILNPQATRRSFALHYSTRSVYTSDHRSQAGKSRLRVSGNTYYYERSA